MTHFFFAFGGLVMVMVMVVVWREAGRDDFFECATLNAWANKLGFAF
jgi:hypothetical protein